MSHDPEQPELDLRDIENHLTAVERAIADPAARSSTFAHGVLLQASWLLSALGRWDTAAAAAELAQACWGKARDAHSSPYGGGLFWAGHRATALAHIGAGDWRTAESYLLDVLRDFNEEDKSFYLFELCLHAQGRRPWNSTRTFVMLTDPARELAAFDARRYALEQYRDDPTNDDLINPAPAAPGEPVADGPESSGPVSSVRWRGVPIPPDLVDDNWLFRNQSAAEGVTGPGAGVGHDLSCTPIPEEPVKGAEGVAARSAELTRGPRASPVHQRLRRGGATDRPTINRAHSPMSCWRWPSWPERPS